MAKIATFAQVQAHIGHNNDILRFSAISNTLFLRNRHFSELMAHKNRPLSRSRRNTEAGGLEVIFKSVQWIHFSAQTRSMDPYQSPHGPSWPPTGPEVYIYGNFPFFFKILLISEKAKSYLGKCSNTLKIKIF